MDSAEEAVVDNESLSDGLEILKRGMSETQHHSLRFRHLEHVLKDKERKRDKEENDKRIKHEGRRDFLRSKGVSTQNIRVTT